MPPPIAGNVWAALEVHAHLPEIQEIIRAELKIGMIRILPGRADAIRILPLDRAYIPDMDGWPTIVLRALKLRPPAPILSEKIPVSGSSS